MSFPDLTVYAGILSNVVCGFIDNNNNVSVSRHDGLVVNMVNECIYEILGGITADFEILMKEVTLAQDKLL